MEVSRKILSIVCFVCSSLFTGATEKTDKFHIIGPTDAVCVGQKINLEASGPTQDYEYFWYPRNKVVTPFLKSTDFFPRNHSIICRSNFTHQQK